MLVKGRSSQHCSRQCAYRLPQAAARGPILAHRQRLHPPGRPKNLESICGLRRLQLPGWDLRVIRGRSARALWRNPPAGERSCLRESGERSISFWQGPEVGASTDCPPDRFVSVGPRHRRRLLRFSIDCAIGRRHIDARTRGRERRDLPGYGKFRQVPERARLRKPPSPHRPQYGRRAAEHAPVGCSISELPASLGRSYGYPLGTPGWV